MRNGNQEAIWGGYTIFARSYRTYEEWKHAFFTDTGRINIRSYRTYEEWKLFFCTSYIAPFSFSSYRTYEEWKLRR